MLVVVDLKQVPPELAGARPINPQFEPIHATSANQRATWATATAAVSAVGLHRFALSEICVHCAPRHETIWRAVGRSVSMPSARINVGIV